MKKYLILAISKIILINLNAQTPKFINYQGLARDASGNPIINQSVALGFTITNGASAPFTDSKNTTTNGFGLFNTTIGSASNPINSNLAMGNFSLITSVNGNILTPQLLASVPYALNTPEPTVTYSTGVLTIGSTTVPYSAGTTYQAGNGISINSGTIINTAPNQTINITSSGIATVSSAYPNFNVGVPTPTLSYNNISNILTLNNGATTSTTSISSSTASVISITGSGNAVVSPTTGSSFNVNVPTQTLSVSGGSIVSSNLGGSFSFPPTPTLALTGGTLTSGVSSNSVNLSTLSPWVKNTNTVSLINPSDSVLIGNGAINGKLSVYQTSNAAPAVYAINKSTSGSLMAHGVLGITDNNGSTASGVKGISTNQSSGVYGISSSSLSSANAHGVYGETNSSAINSYGVYGKNNGAGSGIFGRATNSVAINAYGVYGSNIGLGAGVHGINTSSISSNNGHGVLGITQNTNASAAGVFGQNDSFGPSIYGVKQGGAIGNVANFENLNNTNSNSTVRIFSQQNDKTKPTLLIENTVTSSGLALELKDGRIKSTGTAPTTGTINQNIVPSLSVTLFTVNNATDTKGMVYISYTGGTAYPTPSNSFIEFRIVFAKTLPISATPVVNLTPTSDLQGLSYMIKQSDNTGFTIKLYRSSNSVINFPTSIPPNGVFTFNYFVIE